MTPPQLLTPSSPIRRIVSADPGLMSAEELLSAHDGGRRRSLEKLIEKQNEFLAESRPPLRHRIKEKIKWFLEQATIKISYDDFMMIVSLFVLFGDDIRLLSFPPSADSGFAILTNISFVIFLFEFFLNSWAKTEFSGASILKVDGYMFSFFFWLDLLAILSMIPEIDWLSSMLGLVNLEGDGGVATMVGKAGRLGAKTGRVVRMVRLVRLVKLYKITSQRRRERKVIKDLHQMVDLGHIDENEIQDYLVKMNAQKQSKVGAELSDIITRRVIIAVLIMFCVVPLLSYSPMGRDEKEATQFLHAINVYAGSEQKCEYLISSVDKYKDFMEDLVAASSTRQKYLLSLSIEPKRCNLTELVNFNDLRNIQDEVRREAITFVSTEPTTVDGAAYFVEATFNLSSFVEDQARSGICLTLFVIFMLVTMSAQFTGDAQKLVLAPIESMIQMVNMVAEDPLEDFDFSHDSNANGGKYETRMVQEAIQKITALLRVGFGVAGADIISKNMAVEGEGSAVLDPMIPGRRVYGIFGFTDIYSFDYCTEKLEDEVMSFINSVAKIVHEEVTRWGGLCNKNLGNAFLMVWRIGDEDELLTFSGKRQTCSHQNSSIALARSSTTTPALPVVRIGVSKKVSVDLRRIPGLDALSDKALIGFLKVVVEINRDPLVLSYRDDNRLTNDGTQDFKLRMGFGMHAGWAIEGAVGSLQKVDATYLSPHVNMAARMEAASRQFGVSILMTERFVELMSIEAQQHCRKLDVVTVKGSTTPMPIYTYDTFQNQNFPLLQAPKFSSLSLGHILNAQAKEYDVELWLQDKDLIQLRRFATPAFREVYGKGLDAYITGNWDEARTLLKNADRIMTENNLGGDVPSQTLLAFMENRQWTCPLDWKGYRPLTSK